MSIYRSGYDTTVGVGLVTKNIQNAIKESIIRDGIQYRQLDLITSKESNLREVKWCGDHNYVKSLNYVPIFIIGQTASESNIPFFEHPIFIENDRSSNSEIRNYVVSDIRPFVRTSGSDIQGFTGIAIRNKTEFNFMINRTMLNIAWANKDYDQLKMSLHFAGVAFATWLAESISKRFALDPADQQVLTIIAHFYYQSLFEADNVFSEETIQRFAVQTMKATKASSQTVFKIFDKIKTMGSLADFCNSVKAILDNIRLDEFGPGLLITMVSNTWYGMNAERILAVALEHPPTWVSIVYAALNERTFKNSMIARITERYGRNNQGKEYVESFENVLESYVDRLTLEELTFNTFE